MSTPSEEDAPEAGSPDPDQIVHTNPGSDPDIATNEDRPDQFGDNPQQL